jgi:ribonuclease HI
MKIIEVYVDGSCSPTNPGPGACAYAIVDNNVLLRYEVFRYPEATNNIMELTAVIKSLECCISKYSDCDIYLYTDSQYVQKGMTEWGEKWKANKWKNSIGKPVANKKLWNKILKLQNSLNVTCQWIRGHSGHPWNEFVDRLCSNK